MTSINDYYYYPSKLSVTIMQGKEKCVVVVVVVVVVVAAFSLTCSSPIQRSTHEQLQGCFVVEVLLI